MKRTPVIVLLSLLCCAAACRAQWKTEDHHLTGGWHAIYPFVDASDVTLDELLAGTPAILEIWRWNPDALDAVALEVPTQPITGAEWSVWKRGQPLASTFDRLLPNFGYLVHVDAASAPFAFSLKGQVVLPRVRWRNDGLNLVGFPTRTGPGPSLGSYLAPADFVGSGSEVFRYVGGPIDNNPVKLFNPGLQLLSRSVAHWIKTGRFSDYYGPVKVEVSLSSTGLDFGEQGTSHQLHLTNRTTHPVNVTLTPGPSETGRGGLALPPAPLLERLYDPVAQTYLYPPLDGPRVIAVPAGATVARTIVLNRAALGGPAGTVHASILTVTDSDNHSRIDVPVRARASDLGGLWIGEARITRVQNQLQQFEREADGSYKYDASGQRIPLAGTGDSALHGTAQGFPIRLIVHVDSGGQARLLSTLFAGPIATAVEDAEPEFGLATAEGLLDAGRLADATRLTSVHFPLDLVLGLGGGLGPGGTLDGDVILPFDDGVNPFMHTYHPDHDNKDARFEKDLPDGRESFTITRALTLAFDGDGGANPDPAWGTSILTGVYKEQIIGIHKNTLDVEGPFALRRISDLKELHAP